MWVPGHERIDGIQMADELVNNDTKGPFINAKPFSDYIVWPH